MLIFLNGSINAGKSTVAKLLAKELPNVALVEIDTLREMIARVPIDKAVPINLENAVSVIRNFTKRDLNVIILYPLSEKNYQYMRVLKRIKPPHLFRESFHIGKEFVIDSFDALFVRSFDNSVNILIRHE